MTTSSIPEKFRHRRCEKPRSARGELVGEKRLKYKYSSDKMRRVRERKWKRRRKSLVVREGGEVR
jgi:hypothetical protein